MSKLPPGFTHELRHHLTHKVPQVDPLTGVPILPLEEFCCGSYRRLIADALMARSLKYCNVGCLSPSAAHGFSALIVRALVVNTKLL